MIRSDFSKAQDWGRRNSYNALYWDTITPDGEIIEGPERGD
jgi:hypothetical protein